MKIGRDCLIFHLAIACKQRFEGIKQLWFVPLESWHLVMKVTQKFIGLGSGLLKK